MSNEQDPTTASTDAPTQHEPGTPEAGTEVQPTTDGTPPATRDPHEHEPTARPAEDHPDRDPMRGSRTGAFYAATVGLGLVLILVVIFVAQNTAATTVTFLSFSGSFPVAVVILVAFAAGILFTALGGSLRIMQLRRRAKARERQRKKAAKAEAKAAR
ncbi:LapA family protein [Nocardioides bruguierae]|uniref:LapA family protein n=1 Tax=Nocardioides bruguierae TaxID=2945102 RepID=UPI00201FD755|nr:lipopolysaccharide assembly protein LapA domain-containing protein [Nocardioides bruguierae]MCL8025155.1 lipopolysaccharide assembly protein LapA domain-containing protein [Nocardioides bruguierae]